MPKNILLSSKNIRIILLGFVSILLSFLVINHAYASSVDFNLSIQDSLGLSVSSSSISVDVNPGSNPFSKSNITTTVGTNNSHGYTLTVAATGTSLVEQSDNTLSIPTLTAAVDEDAFKALTDSRWGYKNSRSTVSTTNYLPFASGATISESEEAVNADIANLVFATKVGYATAPGTYSLALTFTATATPGCDATVEGTMQEFNPCPDLPDGTNGSLTDSRDNNSYNVRLINNNWWMIQNLRYMGDTVGSTSTSTKWYLKSATSNVSADKEMTMTDLTSGNTYDAARFHNSGNTTTGVWYNYAAASAMTITGSDNQSNQTYDICPKNWRLPTNSEQSGITSYKDAFSPVTGGYYGNSSVYSPGVGIWWSATSNDSISRYNLSYNGSSLNTYASGRYYGLYVRCIKN